MELYRASALTRSFQSGESRVQALDGLSLSIDEGEFVAITGPSGSGKTTLLQILGLLDRDFEGSLWFRGQVQDGLSDRQRAARRLSDIGFIFQQFNLLDALDVQHNVALLHWRLHGHKREALARAETRLCEFGLGHRLRHRCSRLSAGEMQRVALCRALINEPRVVLADEPTGNLDAQNTRLVVDQLQHIHAEGRTLVVVSHDPEVVTAARRVLVLRYGKLEDAGRGGFQECKDPHDHPHPS